MYNSYFGFSEFPFENNLDQRFLFISDDQKEILAALSYFIKTKKAFAIICGDVGTGKTMLINYFLTTLPEYVQPIIISNPGVSSLELLRYIARALKIKINERDGLLELTDSVKEFLKTGKNLNKQFVLITDEAHLLSDQALEEIRLLSNIETQDQKLLQILLVGQYELSYKLDRPEMRHLRQRININRFLSPLNAMETLHYIDHRLIRVGSNFAAMFEDNCSSTIYKMTGGVPRNINQLCDNALLICMGENQRKIDRRILRRAQEVLLTDRLFTPKLAKRTRVRLLDKFPKASIWAAACAACLIAGIILSQTGFPWREGKQPVRRVPPSTASSPGRDNLEVRKPQGRGSSSRVVAPGGQTSSNSTPAPATRQTVVVHNEATGAPAVGKQANGRLSSPPGQPPKVEVVEPPGQGNESMASPGDTSFSVRRPVRVGETLSVIAAQVYRRDELLGLEAVILDNPEIRNLDLIFPDQVIYLPRINPKDQTIRLRDKLFYSFYGRYRSLDAMRRDASVLEQRGVRYKIIGTNAWNKTASHRIFLGGYEIEEDLHKAVDLVKKR
jgi:type II secretory pathway predicted ATPase ExeA